MPRIYLLSPGYFEHYGLGVHPHPHGDQLITYKSARLPGLCVFSSAEIIFDTKQDFYTQILDQVTQYVAKHLIWLRTRRLLRSAGDQVTVLYQPFPGEMNIDSPEHVASKIADMRERRDRYGLPPTQFGLAGYAFTRDSSLEVN